MYSWILYSWILQVFYVLELISSRTCVSNVTDGARKNLENKNNFEALFKSFNSQTMFKLMNLSQFLILIFMVLSYGEAFNVQKASFCEMRAGIKLQSTCDGCKSFYSRPVKERILLNSKTRRSLKKNCRIISRCCNELILRNMLSWLIFHDSKIMSNTASWILNILHSNCNTAIFPWTMTDRIQNQESPELYLDFQNHNIPAAFCSIISVTFK